MVKKILRKRKAQEKLPTRITNDTVAQHREKVLAGGRKLKYPLQYTKSKLVRNTIIIAVSAFVALLVLVWVQLYVAKDTSDLAYRVTRVLPVPVAKIDGEFVRYSDYLLYHRTTIATLESYSKSESLTSDRLQFHEQRALDKALQDAYARKIAKERNITVSDQKVDEMLQRHRESSNLSESAFEAVVNDQFHWSIDELRLAIRNTIMRQEVAFNVDSRAVQDAQKVGRLIEAGKSLEEIAKEMGNSVQFGPKDTLPENNSDGGLTMAASKIGVDKTSGATKTLQGDGYYFIHRSQSSKGQVTYSYIKVPLTKFDQDFDKLLNSDKTEVFIKIK